jgi:aspartate aminotransferase
MLNISARTKRVAPSATLAMAAKAAELKANGVDVISFATGEPDFDTPRNISAAGKTAIDQGLTRYTPTNGIPELRRAIAKKLMNDNGLTYSSDEIAVTCGAKQAIYDAIQAITDPGDEVIIPAPYWVSYPDQVMLADGVPVLIHTDASCEFKIAVGALKKVVTKKTRAIILNSPSNPSGAAYTGDELRDIGKFCVDNNIIVISDEIYEKLVYDGFRHVSIADACKEAKATTIVINGVSKAYAMTGWRIGYAAGPREVISRISNLVGQQISGIPAFVQKAAIEAMCGPQDELEAMRKEFEARRDIMLEALISIRGVKCPVPKGAFYLFPDMSKYFGGKKGLENADRLAQYLLEDAHIATVSGVPFGSPANIRFSYATSRKNIEEGMRRLIASLSKIA